MARGGQISRTSRSPRLTTPCTALLWLGLLRDWCEIAAWRSEAEGRNRRETVDVNQLRNPSSRSDSRMSRGLWLRTAPRTVRRRDRGRVPPVEDREPDPSFGASRTVCPLPLRSPACVYLTYQLASYTCTQSLRFYAGATAGPRATSRPYPESRPQRATGRRRARRARGPARTGNAGRTSSTVLGSHTSSSSSVPFQHAAMARCHATLTRHHTQSINNRQRAAQY